MNYISYFQLPWISIVTFSIILIVIIGILIETMLLMLLPRLKVRSKTFVSVIVFFVAIVSSVVSYDKRERVNHLFSPVM